MAHYNGNQASEIPNLCRVDPDRFREAYPDLADRIIELEADCPDAMEQPAVAQFIALVCERLTRRVPANPRLGLLDSDRLTAAISRFIGEKRTMNVRTGNGVVKHDLTEAYYAAYAAIPSGDGPEGKSERCPFLNHFGRLLISTGRY